MSLVSLTQFNYDKNCSVLVLSALTFIYQISCPLILDKKNLNYLSEIVTDFVCTTYWCMSIYCGYPVLYESLAGQSSEPVRQEKNHEQTFEYQY